MLFVRNSFTPRWFFWNRLFNFSSVPHDDSLLRFFSLHLFNAKSYSFFLNISAFLISIFCSIFFNKLILVWYFWFQFQDLFFIELSDTDGIDNAGEESAHVGMFEYWLLLLFFIVLDNDGVFARHADRDTTIVVASNCDSVLSGLPWLNQNNTFMCNLFSVIAYSFSYCLQHSFILSLRDAYYSSLIETLLNCTLDASDDDDLVFEHSLCFLRDDRNKIYEAW